MKIKSQRSVSKAKLMFITALALSLALLAYFQYRGRSALEHVDLYKKVNKLDDVPLHITQSIEVAKVHESVVKVTVEDTHLDIFVRECVPATPSRLAVVFLHGAMFSSKNWETLKSLQLCASLGFRAIALDLPGWENSKVVLTLKQREVINKNFLRAFLQVLNITKPILISPSMSGQFSINYLMEPDSSSCSDRLQGFLALAPMRTQDYSHSQYHKCNVPTLIVFGSKDENLGLVSANNLRNMPKSELLVMENAGHACYKDNPADWHKILYYFLSLYSK